MRRRFILRRVCVGAAALAVAASPAAVPSVSASGDTAHAVACTLVSPGQLRSILGLSQSMAVRNYDPTNPSSEAVDTECDSVVWSGPPPTTTQGVFATARSGHGAQIGLETWAPHKGSPNAKEWVTTDYAKLTHGFAKESVAFPGVFSANGLPAKTLKLPQLGHKATGFQAAASGLARGLVAAVGCWWEDKSSSAVCLLDEEAASRPVAAHLVQFAKIAVPKFLGG
jgi:hypothetical protein